MFVFVLYIWNVCFGVWLKWWCVCVYAMTHVWVWVHVLRNRSNSGCTIKDNPLIQSRRYYVCSFVICKGLRGEWTPIGKWLDFYGKTLKHTLIADTIFMNTFDRMIHHEAFFSFVSKLKFTKIIFFLSNFRILFQIGPVIAAKRLTLQFVLCLFPVQ